MFPIPAGVDGVDDDVGVCVVFFDGYVGVVVNTDTTREYIEHGNTIVQLYC